MEYVLHLSYNLDFKAWRTTETTKPIREQTKKRVQNEFRTRIGILVDMVKQGTGTTNNGNTSRRFFGNSTITAEITKIDERLIKRLAVTLEIICSGFAIDAIKFAKYFIIPLVLHAGHYTQNSDTWQRYYRVCCFSYQFTFRRGPGRQE